MDKTLNVLPAKTTIFNLQKFCISDQTDLQSSNGKYALIKDSDDMYYLCQIFINKLLHPLYCHINKSVCCYNETRPNHGTFPLFETFNSINLSDINVIESVENIKSIFVSIVVKNPLDVIKWKSSNAKLCDLVKNILKLFVLKAGSIVSLAGIKSVFETELECIFIESMGNINVGRIVSGSKVKIKQIMSETTFMQLYSSSEELPLLGGLDNHLKTLTDLVKLASRSKENNQPVYKQVLILGPPGCGKTALVRRVARDCGAVVRTVVGSELCSPLPGEAEQALTRVFRECRLLADECPAGCILLLDQVESLCGRRDGSSEGHLVRLSNQLFSLLETVNSTAGLIVVGTSSRPQLLDPAVRRPGRFDHEIHISVSSESERASIVSAVARQLGMSESVSERVAKWTPGFVGADLALLAANVARHMDKQGLHLSHSVEAEVLPCWQHCVSQLRPSCLRGQLGVVAPLTGGGVAALGGVGDIRRCLLQVIQWPLQHPEAFRRLGLPQPKGVLLYGPPGCAKTSLVRAIASATNTTFLAVSAAEIYSPYVGDAERTIAELFHRARIGAPSILFIDEIDALVGCRGHRERGSQERILTAFLTEMDGIGVRLDSGTTQAGVVVVAATNRPQVLDPALTRPGRLDRVVYVGPPDTSQRLDILQTLTAKMPLANDVDLSFLAQKTDLFSGADLAQLCKEAGLKALTLEGMSVAEVSQRHWLLALADMKPSLARDQVDRYRQMMAPGD